jgi:hypothetical protein
MSEAPGSANISNGRELPGPFCTNCWATVSHAPGVFHDIKTNEDQRLPSRLDHIGFPPLADTRFAPNEAGFGNNSVNFACTGPYDQQLTIFFRRKQVVA